MRELFISGNPVVLSDIASEDSKRFSERWQSTHCEGRYNDEDIMLWVSILIM